MNIGSAFGEVADPRLQGDVQEVEILTDSGAVEAKLRTSDPEWSFDQFCRNRVTPGWSWRPKRGS